MTGVGGKTGGNVAVPKVQNNKQNYLTINLSPPQFIPRKKINERQHLILSLLAFGLF